ncbi:unnamed protein product [Lampetra planeri]
METLTPVLKSHPGPSVLLFSLLFRLIHRLLQRLPVPKVVRRDDLHSWKWRNLSVSMVHSLLTGDMGLDLLYVAGAVIALFVEVNSVTLHLRLMLKLAGAQSSYMYHINKFANLFTYITFRLSTQFYLTWYIAHNYSWLDHGGYFLASMIVMNIMILIYFYRLLRADFFSRSKSHLGQNGAQNNNSRKFLSD